jgi:hypothetical protein
MSYKIVQQVSPGVTYNIQLNQGILGDTVEVWNGTPFDLDYYGFGSSGTMVLVAGTGHVFKADAFNVGKIQITPVNNNNVSGTGVVNIVVYNKGDIVPEGRIFPVAIPTQVVSATVSTVQTLSNEGSTAGLLVIDMGDTNFSQLVALYNDGHALWAVDQTGVKHQVIKIQTSGNPLQLGQASDITEVLGILQPDQNVNAPASTDMTLNVPTSNNQMHFQKAGTDILTIDNSTPPTVKVANLLNSPELSGYNAQDLILNYAAGQQLQFTIGGSAIGRFNTAGSLVEDVAFISNLYASVGGADMIINGAASFFQTLSVAGVACIKNNSNGCNIVNFVNNGSLSAITTFSGTGNGTVATGVTTPTAIAFDPCTASGSSQTIGGTNASSSVVTTGAGLAWRGTAWKA